MGGGGASQLEVTVMNFHKQPRRLRTRRTERRAVTLHTRFFLQPPQVVFPPCASWLRGGFVAAVTALAYSFPFSFFFLLFPTSHPRPSCPSPTPTCLVCVSLEEFKQLSSCLIHEVESMCKPDCLCQLHPPPSLITAQSPNRCAAGKVTFRGRRDPRIHPPDHSFLWR